MRGLAVVGVAFLIAAFWWGILRLLWPSVAFWAAVAAFILSVCILAVCDASGRADRAAAQSWRGNAPRVIGDGVRYRRAVR